MKIKLWGIAIAVVFTYILGICNSANVAAAQSSEVDGNVPEITSQTAIVADAESGYIYYDKNMHDKMYPASITKILTGLVAAENSYDSDPIVVTPEAVKGITNDYANIALCPGEEITMEEALYTMFMASANDSANAIAIKISGSIPKFTEKMNERAKELGAVDSNFSNANGMPDEKNLTSSYDMALITQECLKNERVMKYFSAVKYIMPKTNVKEETVEYATLHKMMKNNYYKYDGVFAGKTGYEMMSGHTLVTVAKRDGRTIICVVMKSAAGNACYRDTKALLDFAFAATPTNTDAEYLEKPQIDDAVVETDPVIKPKPTPQTLTVDPPKKPFSKKAAAFIIAAAVGSIFVLAFSLNENRKKRWRKIKTAIIREQNKLAS